MRNAIASNRRQINLNNENGNGTPSAASSRHQTPRRNRREFVENTSLSPHLSTSNCRTDAIDNNDNRLNRSDNRNRKERIYEEPDSPVCYL